MNAQNRIAAARYAAAYDGLSQTLQQAEQNAQELATATHIINDVEEALQSPGLSAAQKKLILNEALHELPKARAFISVLIDAKRLNLLGAIYEHVQTLLEDRQGISRAIITTARVLSNAQRASAQEALSIRYGKTIQADFEVDPALLGGLTAQCNGELLDGSLKTRLEKLRQAITK